ncbi:hypothetical protein [Arthrobacter sp. NIO-1057]|nr:hypothetical protein [Arthrobacter sp. NIO-1057]
MEVQLNIKRKLASTLMAMALIAGGTVIAPAAQAGEHISSTRNGATGVTYKFNHWTNKFCIKQNIGKKYQGIATFYGSHDTSYLQTNGYRKWSCLNLVKGTSSGIWNGDTIRFCLKSRIVGGLNTHPPVSCGYVKI